jgi:hypothetical protein
LITDYHFYPIPGTPKKRASQYRYYGWVRQLRRQVGAGAKLSPGENERWSEGLTSWFRNVHLSTRERGKEVSYVRPTVSGGFASIAMTQMTQMTQATQEFWLSARPLVVWHRTG